MSEQLSFVPSGTETNSCPFCGSFKQRVKPVWGKYWFVACQGCKAGGPVRPTREEAVRAWNGRAGL